MLKRLLGPAWGLDRQRYAQDAWGSEPALRAVAVYRFGQHAQTVKGPIGPVLRKVHRRLHFRVRATMSIELPVQAQIGPGLLIYHQGPVVVNPGSRIGARCKLRQGVTIGVAETGGLAPVLGDDVFVGSNAQILGAVTVGDGATVAAGAVVVADVPAGCTVGGVPARVLAQPPT